LFPVGVADLAAGTNVIKVVFPTGAMNFSAIEINSDGSLAPVPEAPKKETKPAVEEEKVEDKPVTKPANNNPKSGDLGIIILAAVMVASSVVIFRKKIFVK